MATQITEARVITEIDETVTIDRYDIGYMVRMSGKTSEGEYVVVKQICSSLDEVFKIITDADTLPIL